VPDPWDPDHYRRFSAERRQPFVDLLALCTPVPGGTAVDLGCGSGELTAEAHRVLALARTTGFDTSAAMLDEARRRAGDGLEFVAGDLATWDGPPVDVVLANASFHWVRDHRALLARVRRGVLPAGQLAFAVPSAFSHPSHTVAREVADEAPFAAALGGVRPGDQGASVLSAPEYAEVLFSLGASEQSVALKVYGHVLASSGDVVEWVSATLLTPLRARLDDEMFAEYLARYRAALVSVLGDRRPYFYAFPRVLAWARF